MRRARLGTSEAGFGVIELLIAMTVMAIGISASSPAISCAASVALNNASRTHAGTLADKQIGGVPALDFSSDSALGSTTAGASAHIGIRRRPDGPTTRSAVPDCRHVLPVNADVGAY